jgi:hypothetical protein
VASSAGHDHLHTLTGEDLVERGSELGVTVADEEAERCDLVTEVMMGLRGLLRCPCAVWVGGYAEDAYAPGRDLHDEQHAQAFEEIVSTWKKSQASKLSAWALNACLRPSSASQPNTRITIR